MIEYVAGFLVDHDHHKVIMIRKRKNSINGGLWNGVGGKVEGTEDYNEAQAREFHEEAGIWIKPEEWNPICRLCIDDEVEVRFFFSEQSRDRLEACYSVTDEQIGIFSIDDLLRGEINCVHNIQWILMMGLLDIHASKCSIHMNTK